MDACQFRTADVFKVYFDNHFYKDKKGVEFHHPVIYFKIRHKAPLKNTTIVVNPIQATALVTGDI